MQGQSVHNMNHLTEGQHINDIFISSFCVQNATSYHL